MELVPSKPTQDEANFASCSARTSTSPAEIPTKKEEPSHKGTGQQSNGQKNGVTAQMTQTLDSAEIITKLHPHDVILGRGAPLAEYEGNARLRKLAFEQHVKYLGAPCQSTKHAIALELMCQVEAEGGRYLRRIIESSGESNEKKWTYTRVTDRQELMIKIKQLLREVGPQAKQRRSMRREARRMVDKMLQPTKESKPKLKGAADSKMESKPGEVSNEVKTKAAMAKAVMAKLVAAKEATKTESHTASTPAPPISQAVATVLTAPNPQVCHGLTTLLVTPTRTVLLDARKPMPSTTTTTSTATTTAVKTITAATKTVSHTLPEATLKSVPPPVPSQSHPHHGPHDQEDSPSHRHKEDRYYRDPQERYEQEYEVENYYSASSPPDYSHYHHEHHQEHNGDHHNHHHDQYHDQHYHGHPDEHQNYHQHYVNAHDRHHNDDYHRRHYPFYRSHSREKYYHSHPRRQHHHPHYYSPRPTMHSAQPPFRKPRKDYKAMAARSEQARLAIQALNKAKT